MVIVAVAMMTVVGLAFRDAGYFESPPLCADAEHAAEAWHESAAACEVAHDECIGANLSMSVALDALAAREDGCAAFLRLPIEDKWVKYRLEHPKRVEADATTR